MTVRAYPQAAIESHEVKADALVSIRGRADPTVAYDRENFGDRILALEFDDIGVAAAYEGFEPPTREDVLEVIRFARNLPGGSIALHCHEGVSRSTAMALAILSTFVDDDREAVDRLVDAQGPGAMLAPNPLIIRYLDEITGRGFDAVLLEKLETYRLWKHYWRVLVPEGFHLPENR